MTDNRTSARFAALTISRLAGLADVYSWRLARASASCVTSYARTELSLIRKPYVLENGVSLRDAKATTLWACTGQHPNVCASHCGANSMQKRQQQYINRGTERLRSAVMRCTKPTASLRHRASRHPRPLVRRRAASVRSRTGRLLGHQMYTPGCLNQLACCRRDTLLGGCLLPCGGAVCRAQTCLVRSARCSRRGCRQ